MKIFGTVSTKTTAKHEDYKPALRGSLLKQAMSRLGFQFIQKADNAISAVDTQIIQNQRLSLESIESAHRALQARALPLEEHFGGQVLFHFNLFKLPTGGRPGASTYTEIIKPGHVAKLVLAQLYRAKHDVQIYVQKNSLSSDSLGKLITTKIRQNKDEPFGLVLLCFRPGYQVDADYSNEDYQGHVTPVIIQNTKEGFDVINLDSAGQCNFRLERALHFQRNAGKKVRQLSLQEPRQADQHSCHTDAIQVLKDSLIEHQFHGGNLYDRYVTNFADINSRFEDADDYLIDLPPFLQKTSQLSGALATATYRPDTLSVTAVPSKNQRKVKTIAEHRERFLTHVNEAHHINSFLLVKGYRNAFKAIERLEKLPTPEAKAEYFEAIQTNHQLDTLHG